MTKIPETDDQASKGRMTMTSPTGRLPSKGPNLQSISPKTEEFRKIREAFTGPRPRPTEADGVT